MSTIASLYAEATGWIFEHALQPLLYALELMDWAEDAYAWLDFALFGLFGIAVAWAVCRPLEAWRPVESVSQHGAVRTDMLYTFLNRLGVLPLLAFVFLASVQAAWEGWLTEAGLLPPTLEELAPLLRDHPVLAFAAYVVVLDFGEYWRHRAQHAFRWWWALHAIHHAQRQMTFWTDDRNHVLDDIIAAVWFGGIALLIGVPPGQFPAVVLILRLAESLSHANVRLDYGRLGERLLVSPRFHRLHHAPLSAGAHGRNYAVLLPIWDWIFGTGDFRRGVFPPTGAPEEPEALASGGWLRQQAIGLRRMVGAIGGR
ncbi:fatty acid hydroxylase family protein [Dankookia rubra]|uniref:Fatty acid hydroxylase family protein n=1 Tax=Dankookia rubra TaxID=1442381 RepID=A0A4R5QK17_9PROT|nr:sterol desaturase family protein [Dankookia rubra]TDH63061.1 fatty acid hydroxylase family protein [Dankookia rubra]